MVIYSLIGTILAFLYGVPAIGVWAYSIFCTGWFCSASGFFSGWPLFWILGDTIHGLSDKVITVVLLFCILIQMLVLYMIGYGIEKMVFGEGGVSVIQAMTVSVAVVAIVALCIFGYVSLM